MINLYTDGSSTGRNNREWGWGWVLVGSGGQELASDFGGGPTGTNNMGELQGAIEGLTYVFDKFNYSRITLVSDSLYVLKIASGEFTPKKNLDQCKELRLLYLLLKADQKWIRGHSGDKFNNLADQLSKQGKGLYAPNKNL